MAVVIELRVQLELYVKIPHSKGDQQAHCY